MATKYLLAEQVMLRLQGGRPDLANRTDIRDLILAVGQAVNELIKAQYYAGTLPSGETIPDGCVLATYEDVAVTQWKKTSRSQLPAMPVNLPRNMGVFAISKNDDPYCVFIPAQAGQLAMVQSQKMMSDLAGHYAYETYGNYVEYNKNLIADNIDKVMMRLVVKDVLALDDHDVLPIPADFEAMVVDTVFKRFAQQGQSDKDTDVSTENK